jgi:hypothetical protein
MNTAFNKVLYEAQQSNEAQQKKHFPILSLHVAGLHLPDEVKLRLVHGMVLDAPPDPKYKDVNVAIQANQIDAGLSQEKRVDKLVRLALWCLVYYPGQPIHIHVFLTWAGERTAARSQKTEDFTKDYPKYREAIEKLGLECVTLLTQHWRMSAPDTTCDAFRLSVSGNDYQTKVVRAKNAHIKKLEHLIKVVDPSRCRAESVSDPELRASLLDVQKTMKLLQANPALRKLLLGSGDVKKKKGG